VFYHSRPLRHVVYGKVDPAPLDAVDPALLRAYRWLEQYCGYCPQVWLSRSRSTITGWKHGEDPILFGFERIKGFPLHYDMWESLLNYLLNTRSLEEANAGVRLRFEEAEQGTKEDPKFAELVREEKGWYGQAHRTWLETKDVDAVLRKHLFVEHDQVVVPRLNLKAAKKVVCRNERQKKKLRRMGFLEDRIEIR
jgi:hypothetical protein